MFAQGLMLILMLQTSGVPQQEVKDAAPEEYLTLDEIIAEDESSGETPFDEIILKYANKGPELLGPQPPENKEDYAVAIANIMTMPAKELFAFAQYQGELPKENLGKDIKLGESEARLALLEIVDDMESVSKYYLRELQMQNISPMINQLKSNSIYFAFRGSDGFMRTITLVEIGKQTIVFAAVSDAEKVYESFTNPNKSSKFIDNWREPPVENASQTLQQAEGEIIQQTRHVTVLGKDIDEVVKYYVRELTLVGWRLEGSISRYKEGRSLVFQNDNSTCRLSIMPATRLGRFESLTICQTR